MPRKRRFTSNIKNKYKYQLSKEGLTKLGSLSASQPAANKEDNKDDKKGGKKEEAKSKVEEKPKVEEEEDAGGFGDLFG